MGTNNVTNPEICIIISMLAYSIDSTVLSMHTGELRVSLSEHQW